MLPPTGLSSKTVTCVFGMFSVCCVTSLICVAVDYCDIVSSTVVADDVVSLIS